MRMALSVPKLFTKQHLHQKHLRPALFPEKHMPAPARNACPTHLRNTTNHTIEIEIMKMHSLKWKMNARAVFAFMQIMQFHSAACGDRQEGNMRHHFLGSKKCKPAAHSMGPAQQQNRKSVRQSTSQAIEQASEQAIKQRMKQASRPANQAFNQSINVFVKNYSWVAEAATHVCTLHHACSRVASVTQPRHARIA